MSGSINSHLKNWIAPIIAWTIIPDTFVVIVSVDDDQVVEFMSTGIYNVPQDVELHSKKAANAYADASAVLIGRRSLYSEICRAAWDPGMLKPNLPLHGDRNIKAYFVGAFLLDDENLGIIISRSKQCQTGLFPDSCKAKVDEILIAHTRAASPILLADPKRIQQKVAENNLNIKTNADPPILSPKPLLPYLPKAVVFKLTSADFEKQETPALKAISQSSLSPSRDGSYFGFLPSILGRGAMGLISWTPHIGPPGYPEVVAAVQMRVGAAFEKPRRTTLGRPEFDSALKTSSYSVVNGVRPEDLNTLDRFDRPAAEERSQSLRHELAAKGFEAIAWYQPYHKWSAETWGIYFDAAKLDDLAYCIYQDIRSSQTFSPYHIAAFLAFRLTLEHELFHARVEAAASWLELTAVQPRYLRYDQRVYNVLRNKSEWLEEALANWSSWHWFKSAEAQEAIRRSRSIDQHLERVVENTLDLSPPGYREWRQGASIETWRILATQLVQGKPKLPSPAIGLPLESILNGAYPYDFQPSDVPLRFIGTGIIADCLLGHPTTLNVPSHAELEKALKYYEYVLDRSGGKGSHEKWTGPNQKAFILPKRDPVSLHVFKTFLQHIGIDKSDYLHTVRPNL